MSEETVATTEAKGKKSKTRKAVRELSVATQKAAEFIDVTTLKMADYNPREMSREAMRQLKASLKKYGFVQPVVARREDNLIIGGHQRVAALLELMKEEKIRHTVTVPVVFLAGLSDHETKLLNIGLNKISGTWDYDALARLFLDMRDLPDDMLTLSGFEIDERKDVLDLLPGLNGGPEIVGDADALLGADALRFSFLLPSAADAEVVRSALRAYGMTGPRDAPAAFMAAMRAALGAK